MKIVVCGSMVFYPEMLELRNRLQQLGHSVALPESAEEYTKRALGEFIPCESAHDKGGAT